MTSKERNLWIQVSWKGKHREDKYIERHVTCPFGSHGICTLSGKDCNFDSDGIVPRHCPLHTGPITVQGVNEGIALDNLPARGKLRKNK